MPIYETMKTADNISCYKSEKIDNLPAAEDLNPSARSIYFIETSCKGDLNPRQACSVESVARVHPNRTVYILFLAPIAQKTFQKGPISNLKIFDNVEFARIHFWKFVEGTVLEGLVYDGYLNKSKWPVSHTSDVLRYLVLHKWGGTYLDLDVIVRKNLDSLGLNWASRENQDAVASCVLSFSTDAVGRSIANATVQ
ncbi:Lactosylceramide 4-alpha-galactosyltransferase [Eumeta japonica]|uniref:Lactosylceramide 4-alpha-galactosyltransferase n=1 Tax=Eumeta variegata TaxID=151549 RepID=A0A4C1WZA0_EUMVA|nr:Lactosylceramide 4-alpha-galactosyltransferase [Eumeta japonica]